MSKDPIEGEDEDVAAEIERVLCGGASEDLIRIENLTKVSCAEPFLSVTSFSVGGPVLKRGSNPLKYY